jgi:hypothetical protein
MDPESMSHELCLKGAGNWNLLAPSFAATNHVIIEVDYRVSHALRPEAGSEDTLAKDLISKVIYALSLVL